MMDLLSILNNEAVYLLIDQQHQHAADTFHEALCHIRKIISALPPQHQVNNNTLSSGEPSSSIRRVDVPMPDKCISLNREDMFLYFKGLAFAEPSDLHPSTLALYCSVILFNTAILYHMEGITQGRMQLMDRARQIYQSSLDVLNGQDLTNNDTTVLLLHLAVNNNLSQIELEKGMVDAANARLGYALALLQRVKSRALGIFSGTELHGFLLNCSLQGKILSAAAA